MIQPLKSHTHPAGFGAGLATLLVALAGVLLFSLTLGKGLRDASFDIPFLFKSEQRIDNVVIVFLDENSLNELKVSPTTFDRGLHAKLVRRLQQEGAKLIAFDVLFVDKDRPIAPGDLEFAAAMKESRRVLLAGQYFEDADHNPTFLPPIDLFRAAAAGWGEARVDSDTDFAARRLSSGTDRFPCLAWKAAELTGARIAATPEERPRERWLNYYSSQPFQGVPYSDLVTGKPLPPGLSFKDKVVFVGAGEVTGYGRGQLDQFPFPWTRVGDRFLFGVQLHAITFSNLSREDWMTRASPIGQMFLLIVGGAASAYLLGFLRPLPATGAALGIALLVSGVSVGLANTVHVWWSWMIFVAVQVPMALAFSYLIHSVRSHVQTRVLQTSLERYLSPKQAKQILDLRNPALLKPGASQKTVSILFSDIAGFSKISERMNQEDLAKLLNEYYETTIGCVHQTGGTVLNLVGDAIFAIWNAPQEQADHQSLACESALLLHEALARFESKSSHLPLNTAVALHTGVTCVGNIGSNERFVYTAIGESVNMTARLDGLNRQLSTRTLATREFQKGVEALVVSRLVGHFKFKGFDQVVEVHEVLGRAGDEPGSLAWRESFAAGLNRFQRKAFKEAEAAFARTLELRPSDGPSRFYLERIRHLSATSLASDWFGEIDLREK